MPAKAVWQSYLLALIVLGPAGSPARPGGGREPPTRIDRRRCGIGSAGIDAPTEALDPQPRAPEHDDQRVEAMAVAIVPGLAHDRDDLINRWRSAG